MNICPQHNVESHLCTGMDHDEYYAHKQNERWRVGRMFMGTNQDILYNLKEYQAKAIAAILNGR